MPLPTNKIVDRETRDRIERAVDQCIVEDRIPLNQRDAWVSRAMADETVLDQLRALPPKPPGGAPLNLRVTATDPRDASRAILNLWGGCDVENSRDRAIRRANIIADNRNRLDGLLNANTVNPELQRTVAMQDGIGAFATTVLSLRVFATTFGAVRLEGTDKVSIPYYPLHTAASVDWVAGNGYVMAEDVNSDAKTLTVDRRKYQPMQASSSDIRRQPFMNLAMGLKRKGEKLGVDVVTDILSVITAANFGDAFIEPAASFDSDDVIDLKGVADEAGWPQTTGRALVLGNPHAVSLLKDPAIGSLAQFGRAVTQNGDIKRILGFDLTVEPNLPTNDQFLSGFICWPSSVVVAFSPITPSDSVRDRLARYEQVVDPITGATFEYRAWGDPDMDQSRQIVEANYGFAVGEAAALKRICSQ